MEKTINGVHKIGAVSGMFQMFGPNGATMTPVNEYKLDRGVMVYGFGAGMSECVYVVVDDKMNAIALDPYSGREDDTWVNTDWTREVNLEEDKYLVGGYFSHRQRLQTSSVRPISEKFGIGFYFDESGELVSDERIAQAEKYCAFLDRVTEAIEQAKERASNEERKRCENDYPYLTRIDNMGKDWKLIRRTTGNNVRAELKHHFPTTKFSVRYSSFSGGDEYRIEWMDGPTYEAVDAVAHKFQLYHPDELSQGDYWDPCPSHFTKMYGDASYIMVQRGISDEAVAKARAKLLEYNPNLTDDNVNNMALPFTAHCMMRDLNEAARIYARELDFQEPAKEEPKKEKKTKKMQPIEGEFQMIDYSEKCVAVVGDTKAVKDRLKEMGGRFNGKLTCGAGWVFPKSKVEQLKQLLNL